ncbi:MAG TPA: GyrI-like domain-containing protein [Steroidobacteraceae bacterium]|nr:GyrI-like domain-containing protein [Steroidobacteraceae bacterium]
MTIKILERPALDVVGMAIRTRPMSPEIPALWPKFVARIDEIQGLAEPRVSYGVMRMQGDSLHYMAAVSVSGSGSVPEGMETSRLPAGTYASFSYPLSALGKGFGEIYDELLPSSGYAQIPGQPLYERYDEAFDPGNPHSMVHIGIPVRRKA